jgi:CheY-like chemotaxis protein
MARILLVEDNEMVRDMLSERLEHRGHQVVLAVDGAQGVAIAGSEALDLILMDMGLPVIDGWQATRRIKLENPVPIIGLTGHALVGDREKCLEAGCDEYEAKPIDFPRLLAKIQALVDGRQPG